MLYGGVVRSRLESRPLGPGWTDDSSLHDPVGSAWQDAFPSKSVVWCSQGTQRYTAGSCLVSVGAVRLVRAVMIVTHGILQLARPAQVPLRREVLLGATPEPNVVRQECAWWVWGRSCLSGRCSWQCTAVFG